MYALIMAGGSGTRLWPVSRKKTPKQLLKLIGDRTLLEHTFRRLSKGFSSKEIFIATTRQYASHVRMQLPKISKSHYSIEPALKDRGPAIGLAALIMNHHDPDSSFVTAWADHFIKDEDAYFKTLNEAEKYLHSNPTAFLTIGAKPTYPHTGLGYIEQGSLLKNKSGLEVYNVKQFKEKPDLKTAEKFLKSGKFLWNTGYFICKTSTLLSLYQKHLPEIYGLLMQIKPFLGTKKQQTAINKYYSQMPKVDIERGLIEKLDNIAVLPARFDWADIGSWKIIKDVLSIEEENLTHGNVTTHNTKKSLIYNYESKLVAVVGAEDLVIINTKDALVIAPKHRSEEIKELVKKIEADKKLKKYL
jgi:mannose-1-phosphate guanylyltransferase